MARKWISAEELLAKLNADPKFVADKAMRDADLAHRQELLAKAEDPLLRSLADVGFRVSSVWDLVNNFPSYASCIPVLLEHFTHDYPDPIREGIARALAVPEAASTLPRLVELLRCEKSRRVRDGLAAAVSAVTAESNARDLLPLVSDVSLGTSRVLLLEKLARCNDPSVRRDLMSLRNDPELQKEMTHLSKKYRLT